MGKVPQTPEYVKVIPPDTTALATQSKQLVSKFTIVIRDQDTLDKATALAKLGDQWIENAEAAIDPVVDATHAAHKAAVKMRNDLIAPIAGPLKILKSAIFAFVEKTRREARQKQLDAEAEQNRKNKEDADRIAKAAKKQGADTETVHEIRETVLARPAPVVEPRYDIPQDVSTRTTWDVDREKYDLYALCAAIVKLPKEGNHLLELVEPNWVNLRRRAVSGKESTIIPGFTVKKSTGGSIR